MPPFPHHWKPSVGLVDTVSAKSRVEQAIRLCSKRKEKKRKKTEASL